MCTYISTRIILVDCNLRNDLSMEAQAPTPNPKIWKPETTQRHEEDEIYVYIHIWHMTRGRRLMSYVNSA